MLKDKYDIVISYLNDWLRCDKKVLLQFKNIPCDNFFKYPKHNKNSVIRHFNKLKQIIDMSYPVDLIPKDVLLHNINHMLNILGYILVRYNNVYSIKMM